MRKREGDLIVGVVCRGTRRPEDADLLPVTVVVKHAEGMPQLFDRPIDDLQVEGVEMSIMEPEHAGQKLFNQRRLEIVLRTFQKQADLAQHLVVRRHRAGTARRDFHGVFHARGWRPVSSGSRKNCISCSPIGQRTTYIAEKQAVKELLWKRNAPDCNVSRMVSAPC